MYLHIIKIKEKYKKEENCDRINRRTIIRICGEN
jgi:hypothetical protein